VSYYGDQYSKAMGIKINQMDKYHGKEVRRTEGIQCHYCEDLRTTATDRAKHLKWGMMGGFPCRAKQHLVMIWSGQSGKVSHVCRDCGKGFITATELLKKRLFHCEDCGQSFGRASHLEDHKAAIHEGVKKIFSRKKNHKCTVCDISPAALRDHVEKNHSKVAKAQQESTESDHPFI